MTDTTSGPINQAPDERIALAVARAMCGKDHPCAYHVRLAWIAVPVCLEAAGVVVVPHEGPVT